MQGLDELFAIFTSSKYKVRYMKAKATATCLVCGKPAARFSSNSAILEYNVSALCEKCQDWYFKGTRPPCSDTTPLNAYSIQENC